jgi:hypothetical protein
MRRYDIVSGILLILSIIDFALAAPVPVQEIHPAPVDMVYTPKDVMTVGKRTGDEELLKWAEDINKLLNPVDSSDAHASSGSPTPGPEHGTTDVAPASPPNPVSSTADPGPVVEQPPSPPLRMQKLWRPGGSLNTVWDDASSTKSSDASNEMFFSDNSEHGSVDGELTGAPALQPNMNPNPNPNSLQHLLPYIFPSADADPTIDWVHWTLEVNPELKQHVQDFGWPEVSKSPPKEVGDAMVSDPERPEPWKGTVTNVDWDNWADEANPLALSPLRFTTKLDGHPNLMGSNPPPSPTEVHSYAYPGSAGPSSSTGPKLPTVLEHESPALQWPGQMSPKEPEIGLPTSPWSWPGQESPKEPEIELPASPWSWSGQESPKMPNELAPPPSSQGSPNEFGNEEPPLPSTSQGSLNEFGNDEPPPLSSGQLLEKGLPKHPELEEDSEVHPGQPTSPDSELDLESLSQPVDLQAVHAYATKGKVKEWRRAYGTARDVGNAAQA